MELAREPGAGAKTESVEDIDYRLRVAWTRRSCALAEKIFPGSQSRNFPRRVGVYRLALAQKPVATATRLSHLRAAAWLRELALARAACARGVRE